MGSTVHYDVRTKSIPGDDRRSFQNNHTRCQTGTYVCDFLRTFARILFHFILNLLTHIFHLCFIFVYILCNLLDMLLLNIFIVPLLVSLNLLFPYFSFTSHFFASLPFLLLPGLTISFIFFSCLSPFITSSLFAASFLTNLNHTISFQLPLAFFSFILILFSYPFLSTSPSFTSTSSFSFSFYFSSPSSFTPLSI